MPLPRCTVVSITFLLGLASCWALPGCETASERRSQLASGNPLDRAHAIVEVAERGEVEAIHKLVDLLEDSDKGVRMYAILALRRLCGVDHGYHYYAKERDRAAAVTRWRHALRAGEVKILSVNRALEERSRVPRSDESSAATDAGVRVEGHHE